MKLERYPQPAGPQAQKAPIDWRLAPPPNINTPYHALSKEERRLIKAKRSLLHKGGLTSSGRAKRNPRLSRVAQQLVSGAKDRALVQGVPFTIRASWVFDRLVIGVCEITGLPFELTPAAGSRSNFIPSLDRESSKLGYTPENCRVVIWGYNAAKSSGTDDDVMRMAEALVRQKALRGGKSSS